MTESTLVSMIGIGVPTRIREHRAIALVSSAHFVNHFQNLVLPPLFPFLKAALGIGFLELGFALTVANILSVVAQLPIGYLVDRIGSRRMLVLGLGVSATALITFGLSPSYPRLLLAAALLGLANSVFHPADYALLSAQIASAQGRSSLFDPHFFRISWERDCTGNGTCTGGKGRAVLRGDRRRWSRSAGGRPACRNSWRRQSAGDGLSRCNAHRRTAWSHLDTHSDNHWPHRVFRAAQPIGQRHQQFLGSRADQHLLWHTARATS